MPPPRRASTVVHQDQRRAAGLPREASPMSKLDDLIAEVSVTRRLVSVAAGRSGATALVGGALPDAGPGGGVCSYSSFAAVVQAAAAGLTWRGLRPGDVVGVIVSDACAFTLGVHAARAAGGVPSPVDAS